MNPPTKLAFSSSSGSKDSNQQKQRSNSLTRQPNSRNKSANSFCLQNTRSTSLERGFQAVKMKYEREPKQVEIKTHKSDSDFKRDKLSAYSNDMVMKNIATEQTCIENSGTSKSITFFEGIF